MFPVDSLPPLYCEERAAAESARRLAQHQKETAVQAQVKAPVATRQSTPSILAQTLQPPLSRPGSSSVLGNIFQGFVKRASSNTPSPAPSAVPSRVQTPAQQASPMIPAKQASKAEMDALLAEIKRDTDICALPSWH